VSNTLVVRFRGSGVAGCGLLVAGCWLRVTGYGLRVARCGVGLEDQKVGR
jgi:hypothetical protein